MNKTLKLLLFLFCGTMIYTGCKSNWEKTIPDGEIVYMSSYQELGFVQANGENNQTLSLDEYFEKPIWSNSGKFLYGLSGGSSSYGGYPAYWDIENSHFKVCDHDMPYFDQIQGTGKLENPYEVVIQDTWEILVMDLAKCKLTQILLDYSDHPGEYSLAGFSYSTVTNDLVYGLVVNPYTDREYKIVRIDITSGDQTQLAEGINPAWSPDGTQIAYIGLDGLYVMGSNNAEQRRLVNQQFFDAWTSGSPWRITPTPRWSPDGEWIVYHRCDASKDCLVKDAKLYKIRLSDSSEEMNIAGGEYPSWRSR